MDRPLFETTMHRVTRFGQHIGMHPLLFGSNRYMLQQASQRAQDFQQLYGFAFAHPKDTWYHVYQVKSRTGNQGVFELLGAIRGPHRSRNSVYRELYLGEPKVALANVEAIGSATFTARIGPVDLETSAGDAVERNVHRALRVDFPSSSGSLAVYTNSQPAPAGDAVDPSIQRAVHVDASLESPPRQVDAESRSKKGPKPRLPFEPPPPPPSLDTHPQSASRPRRGPKSGAETGPVIFEKLPAPPPPLSLDEKYDILNRAFEHLSLSSRKTREVDVVHPFLGRSLPRAVINEFGLSRSLLREVMPGYFVTTRGRPQPTGMTSSQAPRSEFGFALEKHFHRHLFVYKQAEDPEARRPRTILTFVGMLELRQRAAPTLSHLPAYRTTKILVTPIGPDSFVDHSALTPVEVSRTSQHRPDQQGSD
ncbi:hypothetical protein PSEUBRA_004849 [Kalmanozyma brasiliensis GHG001]|uniref:uncharacterized protein n=1 Tax=Kalmanozyma brasiliensis (strain GHG001) TaxID=1365824 RepID=UPI002868281C|nr:uncharacterized protein PSEUBRA_004849 [Kalmanozyma brasiliensis GHG001]KAF6767438.1 hypothetical protein PSEUBRA_004849 [Kalmanozyma brasiliensis GHG001]